MAMDATEFSERLKQYQDSIESEFTRGEASEEAAVKLAQDKLFKALPEAVDELIALSTGAKNDGVRLNASKYIIDACTSDKGIARNADPFSALFGALNSIVPQPGATESEVKS